MKSSRHFKPELQRYLFDYHFTAQSRAFTVGFSGRVTDDQRRTWNLQARKVLGEVQGEPTLAEQLMLARYSGEGTIGNSFNEYYTSPELAEALWGALEATGVQGEALDPACGTGVLLQHAPAHIRVDAVECDPTSSHITRLLFPQHQVHHMTFEQFLLGNPHKRYDLLVMNPPFGPRLHGGTLDRAHLKEASEYFLQRALECCKGGAVAALVLPYGVLSNPTRRRVRRWLLERSEVLRVHGLPAQAFEHTGATFASTDVWFVRVRRPEVRVALAELDEEDLLTVLGDEARTLLDGGYFEQHPEHLWGSHAERPGPAGRMLYFREGEVTAETWQQISQPLPLPTEALQLPDVFQHLRAGHRYAQIKQIERKISLLEAVKTGDTRVYRGELCIYLGKWLPVEQQDIPAVVAAAHLSQVLKVHAATLSNRMEEHQAMAGQLRRLLLQYRNQHGNPHQNPSLVRLSKRTSQLSALLAAFQVGGELQEALFACPDLPELTFDALDLPSVVRYLRFQGQLATTEAVLPLQVLHPEKAQLVAALKDSGFCFTGSHWVPQGEYYTGLLHDRLRSIEEALEDPTLDDLHRDVLQAQQVMALTCTQRRTIEDLDVKPYNVMLPDWLVQEYARTLSIDDHCPHRLLVTRDPETRLLEVDGSLNKGRNKRSVGTIKRYLTRVGRKHQEAEFYQEWDQGFIPFLIEKGHREVVEDLFNQGTQYLHSPAESSDLTHLIDGWQAHKVPHWYQNAYVHRALSEKCILNAQDVGLGKTLGEILLLLAGKRLGHWRKPLIVAPKNLLPKWRREILAVKPDARICLLGGSINAEGDFEEDTSKPVLDAQLWDAILHDWDFTLMFRDTFTRVSLSDAGIMDLLESEFYAQNPDFHIRARHMSHQVHLTYARVKVKHLLDNELLTLEEAERAASDLQAIDLDLKGYQGRTDLTGAEKLDRNRKRELRARTAFIMNGFQALNADRNRLETVWEDCNFDVLAVDEAHAYVNLWTLDTQREHVKYLAPPSDSSNRAVDLYFKVRALHQKLGGEKNVHLLTATPLSNSMVDIYNLISILKPSLWLQAGIVSVEKFVERYCHITTERHFDPEKDQYVTTRCLTGIQNARELRTLTRQVIDRRTAEQVGLKLPAAQLSYLLSPADALQEHYFAEIFKDPTEGMRKYLGSEIDDTNEEDFRLALFTLIRRVELDLEMLDPESHQGYVSPKVRSMLDAVKEAIKAGEKVLLVADAVNMPNPAERDKPNPHGYNFHRKLQQLILQENPLQASQVCMVNAQVTPDAASRQQVSDDFNAGRATIVIGNSACLGEGMDFQVDARNLYRLDVPINPKWFLQVNGRVRRQGNHSDFVRLSYFLCSRGLDVDTLDLLGGKMNWFQAFWEGDDDFIQVEDHSLIPSREQLLTLAIEDEQERKRQLQDLKVRQGEERQTQKTREAIQVFRRLQISHSTLGTVTHLPDGRPRTTFTLNQQRDLQDLRHKIHTYRKSLQHTEAFGGYQHLLEAPLTALIDPKSLLVLQTEGHVKLKVGPDWHFAYIKDIDVKRNRVSMRDLYDYGAKLEFTLRENHPHELQPLVLDAATLHQLKRFRTLWTHRTLTELGFASEHLDTVLLETAGNKLVLRAGQLLSVTEVLETDELVTPYRTPPQVLQRMLDDPKSLRLLLESHLGEGPRPELSTHDLFQAALERDQTLRSLLWNQLYDADYRSYPYARYVIYG